MTIRIPPITTPVAGEGDDDDPKQINSLWYRYLQSLQQSIPGEGIPEAPQDGKLYGRQDAAWQEVPSSEDVDLGYSANATAGTVSNTSGTGFVVPTFTRQNAGLVPAPITGTDTRFLREDGTWQTATGGGGVTVNTYSTPGTHTWTKPSGAKLIRVIAVGGGGGGGSGGALVAADAGAGGGGGGGGASKRDVLFDATTIPSTVTVTVGAGGAGGARVFTLVGNSGVSGSISTFGTILTAYGGGAGGPGQNTGVTGGGGGGVFGAGQNNGTGGNGGGGDTDSTAFVLTVGAGSGGGSGAPDQTGGSAKPAVYGPLGGGGGGAGRPSVGNTGGSAYEFGKANATVAGGTSTGGTVPITNGASVSGIAASFCGAGGGGGGGGVGGRAVLAHAQHYRGGAGAVRAANRRGHYAV